MYRPFLTFYPRDIFVLIIGCIVLATVICMSRHWKYVLRDSVLNSALIVGFGLLLFQRHLVTALISVPIVLGTVIAVSSWAHSDLLTNLDKRPRYIRLYPTRFRTLVLVGVTMLVAIQLVMDWRERAYSRTAELLDFAAIEASVRRSPSAVRYLEALKAEDVAALKGKELIEACGRALRLAESDGFRVVLPHPADTICRSTVSYRKSILPHSN